MRAPLRRRVFWIALCLVTSMLSAVYANGRPPITNGVFFRPGDNQSIFVRATFGLLVSRDNGCSFRWICEQNIGYGGTFDPKYAVAADGTIFATTFEGLRVSRDGGCSFTTATAELPAGAPGRFADVWTDALDLGPTGDVWVATSEGGRMNEIYRSTDNGITFEPRGMQALGILWKSVRVAPSDAQRVYASGYELAMSDDAMGSQRAHLYASTDAGGMWTRSPLTGMQFYPTMPLVVVAAVDPTDPLRIYVVSALANAPSGDRLYRSIDGGMSFTEVLATTESIQDVTIVDATTVYVATFQTGGFKSDNAGVSFAPLASPAQLACVGKQSDGTVIGCGANWDPDFMAVARATPDGQWQKTFRFVELAGPVECPAGTAEHDVCGVELWPTLQQQFGATGPKDPACALPIDVDAPPDPPKSGGCCSASAKAPVATLLLALLLGGRLLRPRRRVNA